MIIDIHCHYTLTARRVSDAIERFSFEPPGRSAITAYDSCVSPRFARSLAWRLMRLAANLPPDVRPSDALDERLESLYACHLHAEGPIERFVLLAFDAYHTDAGERPPLPARRDQPGSDIYTSNSLIRALCRAHPQRFLFGASVHPYRPAAVACVEEVFAAGAVLLKWLPLHQNISPHDARTQQVLRCCARLGLPVLIHCGAEFTLATQHPAYMPFEPWLEVLRRLRREGRMPPTIIAHVATPVLPWQERRSHRLLVRALRDEFADEPLYADISALTAWGKAAWLRKVAAMQDLHAKLLFGTDFPVPVALPRLRRVLRCRYDEVRGIRSWPQQAARICQIAGFNEIVFCRAASVLANCGHLEAAAAANR